MRCLCPPPPLGPHQSHPAMCCPGLQHERDLGRGRSAAQVRYGWLNREVMVARNCSDPPEPRCGGPENQAVVRPRACRFGSPTGRAKSPGNKNGPDDLVAAWFLSVPRSALWGSAAVATAACLRSMADMQPRGGGHFRELVWKHDRWPHPMIIQPVYLACAIYQIM